MPRKRNGTLNLRYPEKESEGPKQFRGFHIYLFCLQAQVVRQLAGVHLQSWVHSFPEAMAEAFEGIQNHGIKVICGLIKQALANVLDIGR